MHLMQLKPLFQAIVHDNAQCVIQLKTIVSALTQLSNEHKILLGSGKDKQIIMKVGVRLRKVAEMLRIIKKEVMQDLKHCGFPQVWWNSQHHEWRTLGCLAPFDQCHSGPNTSACRTVRSARRTNRRLASI